MVHMPASCACNCKSRLCLDSSSLRCSSRRTIGNCVRLFTIRQSCGHSHNWFVELMLTAWHDLHALFLVHVYQLGIKRKLSSFASHRWDMTHTTSLLQLLWQKTTKVFCASNCPTGIFSSFQEGNQQHENGARNERWVDYCDRDDGANALPKPATFPTSDNF